MRIGGIREVEINILKLTYLPERVVFTDISMVKKTKITIN